MQGKSNHEAVRATRGTDPTSLALADWQSATTTPHVRRCMQMHAVDHKYSVAAHIILFHVSTPIMDCVVIPFFRTSAMILPSRSGYIGEFFHAEFDYRI